MNNLFLLSLFVLFFISYILTGKDLMNVSTMMCISFIFCTISALYLHSKWNFTLQGDTILLIDFFIFLTILINMLVHKRYVKTKYLNLSEKVSPISKYIILGSTFLSIFTIFMTIRFVYSIAGGAGSYAKMMLSFRSENAYSTNLDAKLPTYITQLQKILTCYGLVLSYNLIYFWERLSRDYRLISAINIIIIGITPIFSGSRYGVLTFFIAIYTIYYLIKIRKNKTIKVIKTNDLIKTICVVLIFLYGFYAVKEIVGRSDDSDLIEYICHYAGGSIPNFDIFLHSQYPPNAVWGKETFYSLINGLRKLKLLDIDYYIVHHEYHYLNGNSLGNVYVALRDYIHDFGLFGALILHIIFSYLFSIMYEHAKRKSGSIGLILVGMIYYCVVMYGFQNAFYANVVSFGYLIQAVEIILLYKILIAKRIFKRNIVIHGGY